jgi:hypothetical protein
MNIKGQKKTTLNYPNYPIAAADANLQTSPGQPLFTIGRSDLFFDYPNYPTLVYVNTMQGLYVYLVYVNTMLPGLSLEGGWALSGLGISTQGLHKLFYFLFLCAINPFMAFYADGGFSSIPHEPRDIRATEARLEKIYEAAKRGLKGDALALASGMLPTEYRRLIQLDPIAEYAEIKGRAEGEMEMADVLRNAAMAGDTKAALDVLKHVHKWTAPQSMQIQVEQRISILAALEEAQTRVIEGIVLDNAEAADAGTSDGLLTNRNEDGGYDPNYARTPEKSIEL